MVVHQEVTSLCFKFQIHNFLQFLPREYVFAECHIDDDIDFTFDQVVVGKIAAPNFALAAAQCLEFSKKVYGAKGSGGIRNLGFAAPFGGLVIADCHLDDDPDFTPDQVVFGKIRGRSVGELVTECADLARLFYGARGSSGLKNVVMQ